MQLTCPSCGVSGDLEFWVIDETERQAIGIALSIPRELKVAVLGYLKLFEPPQRRLSVSRAVKILGELEAGISAAQVHYRGRIWPAPLDYWRQALDEMLMRRDSLKLPIKNHNYLLAIVAGYADKADAKAEAKAEEIKRHRTRSDSVGAQARKPMRSMKELYQTAISKPIKENQQ